MPDRPLGSVEVANEVIRSEEHTSELQSQSNLVCRLLLVKQNNREVDILARQAISSGAKAEDMALVRRASRERREEIERRDLAVRNAEETAETANQEITRF